MTKEELQKKFYYVEIRNKYELLKAHDLLNKIDMPVFSSNEKIGEYLNGKDWKGYLIKESDGWRIQSHFIGTDNSVEELEEEVNIFLRKKERENISEQERENCGKLILKLNKELQAFSCLASISYDSSKDLEEVISKVVDFNQRVSQRWDKKLSDFKKSEDFNSTLESYIRDNKLNEIL